MTEISEQKSPEREAAEVAKLVLEAEKLKADIESVKIEQRLKEAEARKALALATEAEHDAEMRKIRLEENKRGEALVAVTDFYQHIYVFDQPVSQASVNGCLNTLNAWHRMDSTSEWTLVINSPGGSVIAGMHLFDELAAHSLRGGGTHRITISARGIAASMGGILLQAGDVRKIGAESHLMVHEISAGTVGKVHDIVDSLEWYKKVCERIVGIFVNRSGGKISVEEFKRKWERIDWYLDSSEALAMGFVDEIG